MNIIHIITHTFRLNASKNMIELFFVRLLWLLLLFFIIDRRRKKKKQSQISYIIQYKFFNIMHAPTIVRLQITLPKKSDGIL